MASLNLRFQKDMSSKYIEPIWYYRFQNLVKIYELHSSESYWNTYHDFLLSDIFNI